MAVISARIDDKTKQEAEKIADSIGLTLSTVISVFLNRFIAEKGFPFSVTVPEKETITFNKKELEELVIKAVQNSADTATFIPSAYLDPDSKEIKHTD